MEDQYQYIPGEGVQELAPSTSVAEWHYETDSILTHSSGLRVFFPHRKSGLTRVRCLGYDDTVIEDQAFTISKEISAEKPLNTLNLLIRAEELFHTFPAGSLGAPISIKRDKLARLAEQRRAEQWGYRQVGEFHDGAYESAHVSPLTKSAGMVDAKIFILSRDWASEISLMGALDRNARDFGFISGNRIALVNLEALLQRYFACELRQTYATNLFPFVRQEDIPYDDLERSAREFAIPQIEIVAPKLIICLGLETFNVLRRVNGLRRVNDLAEGLKQPFRLFNADVWIQAHTGYYGRMLRRHGIDEAWQSMAKASNYT